MPAGLSYPEKIALAVRIWALSVVVEVGLRRQTLPVVVARLGQTSRTSRRLEPHRLSRIVSRSLRLGSRRPRCLIRSLVLFRLLREQGQAAELVIGLPSEPRDRDAHAWVEITGVDVGPAPGRAGHQELVRYR